MSNRPSMQSANRFLIVGAVIGIVLGCIGGLAASYMYVVYNPPVYAGGAYPSELTNSYQDHYLAMVIDSYLVNQQAEAASERFKAFTPARVVRVLGEWSAAYAANGRTAESQVINQLAVELNQSENWDSAMVADVLGQLQSQFEANNEPAKAQIITTLASQLGQVPVADPGQPDEAAAQPDTPDTNEPQTTESDAAQPDEAAAPPQQPVEEGFSLTFWLVTCFVGLVIIGLAVFLMIRFGPSAKSRLKPQEVAWEGEGPPPIKKWSGTYNLGNDTYDEFFTLETPDGDFLGESGMGIWEAVPGTKPKQVTAFEIGLFDKTDIVTRSLIILSESSYNDETTAIKIDGNPQAEGVLAEKGKKYDFSSSVMRIEATIEDMEYGDGEEGVKYFTKLTMTLSVFLIEGADLRIGEMDVPDQFK